jgi:hypothetical protein
MEEAQKRCNKILNEKIKLHRERSESILKLRSDIEKKQKEDNEKRILDLVEIHENIEKTKENKKKRLEMALQKNQTISGRLMKSIDDGSRNLSDLERKVIEKDKKLQEKIDILRSRFELSVVLKKEKEKLMMSDILEKRGFQNKLRLINKSKILNKHFHTSKALEDRKIILSKYEQEIREKGYQLSEKFAQSKHLISKEICDIEVKNKVLITS